MGVGPSSTCSLQQHGSSSSKLDGSVARPRPQLKLDAAKMVARLGDLLDDTVLANRFEALLQSEPQAPAVAAFLALAEQSISMSIDYGTIGLGWHHPRSRMEYRSGSHASQQAQPSRDRAMKSRRSLVDIATAALNGDISLETAVTDAFVQGIGLKPDTSPALVASFAGVSAALSEELLLPLRALNEGLLADDREVKTMQGERVAKQPLQRTVAAITGAVLSQKDGFAEWRYSNPAGKEQLHGLSKEQMQHWRHPLCMEHDDKLQTHEDGSDELGLFWATKIGGPSHGFDYSGHCLLPLLANARHKVIFVNDPRWSHFPAGRAHWRMMWTAGGCFGGTMQDASDKPEPRLWLEALNRDSSAEKEGIGADSSQMLVWLLAVLRHAISKADTMQVTLSVSPNMAPFLSRVAQTHGGSGVVHNAEERILLRPSNGIVEASDELGTKHDWIQMTEEVTEPLQRVLYIPAANADDGSSNAVRHRKKKFGGCF